MSLRQAQRLRITLKTHQVKAQLNLVRLAVHHGMQFTLAVLKVGKEPFNQEQRRKFKFQLGQAVLF